MVHHRHVPANPANGLSTAEDDPGYERMLIDEGLELLQAFRSIESREVRQWICRIVDMIAADGNREPDGRVHGMADLGSACSGRRAG